MFHLFARYLQENGFQQWTVLQCGSLDALIWWVFEPGRQFPSIVGKLFHCAGTAERGRREAVALQTLAPAAGRLGIPTLLLKTELSQARLLLAQSGMPGIPWRDELPLGNRRLLQAQLQPAEHWLADFQSAAASQGTLADTLDRLSALCARQLSPPAAEEQRLLAAAGEVRPALAAVPAVAVHGDFWAGNVLEHQRRLSVVDWSGFHYGSPTEDLYNFVAAMASRRSPDPATGAAHMWPAFFTGSLLARLAQSATLRLLARHNLSQDLLRPLFLLFLLNRLAHPEFHNHREWRAFARRYVAANMPVPFS